MKKETIGLTISMFFLFIGYVAIQNYYLDKNQKNAANLQNMQAAQVALEPNVKSQSGQIANDTSKSQADVSSRNNSTTKIDSVLKPQNDTRASIPLPSTNNEAHLQTKISNATFSFTTLGGCLGANSLTETKTSYNNPTNVSVVANDKLCKAFGVKVGDIDLRSSPASIWKDANGATHILQKTPQLQIEKVFAFSEDDTSLHDFSVEIRNISEYFVDSVVNLELGATSDTKNAGGLFSNMSPEFHSIGLRLPDGKIKREKTPFEASPTAKTLYDETNLTPTWITVDSLYWMNTLVPKFNTPIGFQVVRTGYNLRKDSMAPINQTVYDAFLQMPVHLMPGQVASYNYNMYFGPKSETLLKKFDAYHLNETIDYGFFKIVARPLYYVLSFLNSLVHNWGIAIILLTILINIIFLPLQIKAYVSAQKMQAFQPELKVLQQKYKDDKPTLQKESMALMSKHGVNPLSGCLPLLPQIPVFFGLDSALRHTFALRQAPFFGWIHDLTFHDPYFVLPILMAILMIGYQKMIPMPAMDPTQAKVMKFLPILFSFFMVFYPSGLALYVITNTLVSMIRQYIFMRRIKIPQLQLQA